VLNVDGEDHGRPHPSQEQAVPPAKPTVPKLITPKFTPHSAYAKSNGDRPAAFQAMFQYDAAVALPVDPDADPAQVQPPAKWRKAVPLVLELSASGRRFLGELPLRQVTRVWCFESRKAKTPLVVVDAGDASYSMTQAFTVAHDIGAVTTTTERLRMSFPKSLVARLRKQPLLELTLVGTDSQGRTVLMQTVNGLPSTYAVYAGNQAVSVMTHAEYAWMSSDGWPLHVFSAYDAPIGLRDDDSQPAVPKAQTRKVPLVIDVRCATPLGRTPPLKSLAQLHVFADGWRFLQTVALAACHYRSDAKEQRTWSVDKLTEHLRFAVRPAIAAEMRAQPRWSGHIIGVDATGKTMVTNGFARPA
jgi:hypothetical protein